KAYWLDDRQQFSKPRAKLVHEWTTNVPRHISEEVTDKFGEFRRGSFAAGVSEMSAGEEHNLDLERRKRALKSVAGRISKLVTEQKPDAIYLAAGKEINHLLVDSLEPAARSKLKKNVCLNLTKLPVQDVLGHFCDMSTRMAENKSNTTGKNIGRISRSSRARPQRTRSPQQVITSPRQEDSSQSAQGGPNRRFRGA